MFCDATDRGAEHPGRQGDRRSARRPRGRRRLLPNVPPVAATVPGFDWQAWQGIAAPAGTPRDVVARLAAELARIQATPEFREQLVKFGMEPSPPQRRSSSPR